ncbi:MAG: adhesin [Cytophagales bacterium]|nr:MAG: adhesin [Cytophagales bacterium]TAF59491.1 MAG: adhesin [Cytophagales bacterium]
MSLQSRDKLKSYFKKGSMPQEGHFVDLMDSVLNKIDDGIAKNLEDGLVLSLVGSSPKLLSFFKSIEDKSPAWSWELDQSGAALHLNNFSGDHVLSCMPDGKVGILNGNPEYELDVRGVVASQGRIGTYTTGRVPADGQWHPIIEQLNGCNAFEVMAGAGRKGTGKYALIHAIALSTFGKSKSEINLTQAYYGVRCNKIELKWVGDTFDYALHVRTRCNYGDGTEIQFNVSSLWTDTFMDS